MAGILDQLDAQIVNLFGGWNFVTTLLALLLVAFGAYAIWDLRDPDHHPLLLARQSTPSQVRQPKESAVYRSLETPHGYPLKTGLSVKDPGAPAYSGGRDGDFRDIWKRVTGELPIEQQNATAPEGKILSVFGKEQVEEHSIGSLTKEIKIIGEHIQKNGGKKVAIYLPNSVEFMMVIFAGAFYGFSPILIPYNQPHHALIKLLRDTQADSLIAAAGSCPLVDISKAVSGLRQMIWVVEKTSRHMDWDDVPEGMGGKIDVNSWHGLVQDNLSQTTTELPKEVHSKMPGRLITIWQDKPGGETEIVEFTQTNIIAAVGALTTALPRTQRISPSDLFVSAEALTHHYALCLLFAALYSRASIAFNSVAGTGVELALATQSIAPTIVVASAETASLLHKNTTLGAIGNVEKAANYLQSQAFTNGRMPTDTLVARLNMPTKVSVGTTPGKLRLLFISERVGANTPALSSADLSDIRIYTGARVIYALTAAKVAGAVTQSHLYDYRREEGPSSKHGHFGAPLSSVEVKLVDTLGAKNTDEKALGYIVVKGPAVVGGECKLPKVGTFRDDNTLAYA